MRRTTDWAATVKQLLTKGITAVQIADACGTSRQIVYLWSDGRSTPTGDNAMSLVHLCNRYSLAIKTKLQA